MKKRKVEIILGIVCAVLTFAICVQFKTIDAANSAVPQTFTENKLRDEVLKWKEKYDNAYSKLTRAEEILDQERKKEAEENTESSNIEAQLTLVNKLLGLTELKGKGIIITLSDNTNVPENALNLSAYLVHDGDIIETINELKNAGAEAISINGLRIVDSSGIMCDGNVIRINGEKIGAPYIIKAIGSPEWLESPLGRIGGYLDQISSNGNGVLVKIEKSNDITIPKYSGVYNFEYAKNVE